MLTTPDTPAVPLNVSVRTAAAWLDMTEAAVYYQIKNGSLKAARIGKGTFRIPITEFTRRGLATPADIPSHSSKTNKEVLAQ